MYKKHLQGLALATLSSTLLFAQPEKKTVDDAINGRKMAADTSKHKAWKLGGILALNFNQQTSSYWIGATEDWAISLGASADLYANMERKKSFWDNTLKMAYGLQNNQSQGFRKTSDFIDLFSKYGRHINDSGTLSVALVANLRTQFSDGYDYSVDPKRRTSDFFAPANILVTPGLDWRPCKNFSLFVSPAAAKWVLVTNKPYSYSYPGGVRPDGSQEEAISWQYGVDPEKQVDFQFGAFLSANFNKELIKDHLIYTSRLDLYSNYLRNPSCVDVFWTNNLGFKLKKWLIVTYQWNVAYDDDYRPEGESGPRTQFLGILGVGVTAKF